ncbi:hypothetical protein HZA97_08290, partial [Candidatus Woesearchaeota archaeon]|nr:hypothetical protein [Candidatus Woesearchaeota archaeon]
MTEENKEQKTLEEKVSKKEELSSPQNDVMSVEQYVQEFTARYQQEKPFKKIVHQYMNLGSYRKTKLKLAKGVRWIMPSLYKNQTDELIKDYAMKIREELVKAAELEKELKMLNQAEEELNKKADEVVTTVEQKDTTEATVQQLAQEKESAVKKMQEELGAKKLEEEEKKKKEQEEIQQKTNVRVIVQEKLKTYISGSSLIQIKPGDKVVFNEDKIAEKLEDMMLAEVVADIEQMEGMGFLTKVQGAYDNLITYFSEINDLSEFPDVDWVESIILSRTKGYRYPVFPHLISGKRKPATQKGRIQVASRNAMDISGSMERNDRFAMGKKTVLAQDALMRHLNPNNTTELAIYSEELKQITPAELIKLDAPYGTTRTDLALDWMLEGLKDEPLAIATLLTDGYPEAGNTGIKNKGPVEIGMELAEAAARKYRDHPNVRLRIFFIDGDQASTEMMRKIAR